IAAKDKIGIWGWSYGGYAAMAGLSFYPETYACGIAMYGPPSIVPEEGTAGYGDPYWAKQVGDPNNPEDLKMLNEQSPINYVENITKPLLLTTGARDNRISKPMNDLMAKKMKEAGKHITYFFYPEEGHDYRNPQSWTSFWGIAEDFLHNHLGGKYEPYTPSSDVNYEMVYPLVKNEDSILGNWQAPGNMKFEITKEDDWYIGRVVNPGQITILKKDDFLFKIKKEDEEYTGSYRRYFERDEYVDDPCTFQFVDGEISTSYGVKYRRLSV
ncbi:MAG: alpha/beta hydrolase family protein, partial [Weeksellaceae bacterium]